MLKKIKNAEKLVPNLCDKKEYVVHGTCLKKYIELGLEVAKVHKVISYVQGPWLEDYMELNKKERIKAKINGDKFLEDFYKLMNTSVFCETMENVRNRTRILTQ